MKNSTTSKNTEELTIPELSSDKKFFLIIFLLLFAYPIGIFCMWIWMKSWPKQVKLMIMLPIFLGLIASLYIRFTQGSLIDIGLKQLKQ